MTLRVVLVDDHAILRSGLRGRRLRGRLRRRLHRRRLGLGLGEQFRAGHDQRVVGLVLVAALELYRNAIDRDEPAVGGSDLAHAEASCSKAIAIPRWAR